MTTTFYNENDRGICEWLQRLIEGPLRNSSQTTCKATHDVISSQASADGSTPCVLQDGPTIGQCGPDRAHASHSAQQVSDSGQMTLDTCGLFGQDSSPSASLQRSLESRLRARLDANGSPEYVLTSKHWDMPSGVPICALRAWPRHTLDKGCSGWPRPSAQEMRTKCYQKIHKRREDCKVRTGNGNGFGLTLGNAVTLHLGTTGSEGDCHPALSSWLMGYPDEWSKFAVTATPSYRRSRRAS